MKFSTIVISSLLLGGISLSSCEDILEVDRPDGIISQEQAFSNPDSALMVLNGAYDVLAGVYSGQVQTVTELLGNNLRGSSVNSEWPREIYLRGTSTFNSDAGGLYRDLYRVIQRSNTVIENIGTTPGLTDGEVLAFNAHSRIMRGMGHYELVRLFALPYGYTEDNAHLGVVTRRTSAFELKGRATVKEVYDLVVADLRYAEANLTTTPGEKLPSAAQNSSNNYSIYADKQVAQAMLAKVYFQMNRYDSAAYWSEQVINSEEFALNANPLDQFENNASTENIFAIYNTENYKRKYYFDKFNTGNAGTYRITPSVYESYTENTSDKRLQWFTILNEGEANEGIGFSAFSSDLNPNPALRFSEILLINAEANAELNNLGNAITSLNKLLISRYEDPTLLTGSASANQLIDLARSERQKELILTGEPLQDFKRVGASGETVAALRGAGWDCTGLLLQFPASDLIEQVEPNDINNCN